LDLALISRLSNMPAALVDARHVVAPSKARDHGFSFRGVGRGHAISAK
jgi:hypothetical protein